MQVQYRINFTSCSWLQNIDLREKERQPDSLGSFCNSNMLQKAIRLNAERFGP